MIAEIMTAVGIIGGGCLAVCGVPQLYKTFRTGRADDISAGFLLLWFIGELFACTNIMYSNYCAGTNIPWYITGNYLINLIITLLLLGFKAVSNADRES